MAGITTDTSTKPFEGFSVTLSAGSVTVLDPQPYNNTKEVILLNRSSSDDMLVQVATLYNEPAAAEIAITGNENGPIPLVGDTITIDGNVLTAAAGPYVSGTDTFSIDARATATLTVNSGFSVGDTVTLRTSGGSPGTTYTYTAIAGARAAGSFDFTVDANTTTQAANLVAAFNDTAIGGLAAGAYISATNALNVITVTAGYQFNKRGANGNTSALSANNDYGLEFTTDNVAAMTITDFTGGVNMDGGEKQPDGSILYNRRGDINNNLAIAISDNANSFSPLFEAQGHFRSTTSSTSEAYVTLLVNLYPRGTSGNGLVITESATGITVTSPTAGGTDNIPSSLAAATSTVIPAGAAITLSIGEEGNRQPLATESTWALYAGSKLGIVAQMESGADADLNVTYVQSRGYPQGV